MSDLYVEPLKAYDKLKAAGNTKQTVYVCGATGFGKTALVKNYFKHKKYKYYSVLNEDFSEFDYDEKKDGTLIVDDIQFLKSESARDHISKLVECGKASIVILGRCFIPHWLMAEYVAGNVMLINEDDIRLDKRAMKLIFEHNKISLTAEEFDRFLKNSEGNGFICNYLVRRLKDGGFADTLINTDAWRVFTDYLDNNVLSRWDSEMLDFLMKVSIVDEFTLPLAEAITCSHNTNEMLERAIETGNFLKKDNDVYRMRPILLTALRKRLEKVYGKDKMHELGYNAGLYFEMHEDIVKALEMYQYAQKPQKIKELLIKNAKCKLGTDSYYALKNKYFELEEWEIEENIYLMTGMSMLYSLLMLPEKSEYWRSKLQEYSYKTSGAEQREVKVCLAYLSIALPHISGMEMEKMLVDVGSKMTNIGISIPEFSVTGHMPSVMNSGKDFSNWLKRDGQELLSLEYLIKRVLGRSGLGFANVLIAEMLYEKGEEFVSILKYVTQAQIEISGGGTTDLDFAVTGVAARLNYFYGNIDTAKDMLQSFRKRAYRAGNKAVVSNIDAFEAKLALYSGDLGLVDKWMSKAPDENDQFIVIERLSYLVKVRVYIIKGRYYDAISLLEKLSTYATKYDRIYIEIETFMLSAIAKFRMRQSWIQDFKRCIDLASEYGFVRLIAEEGAAVVPLIEEYMNLGACTRMTRLYLAKLLNEAKNIQIKYPAYLKNELSNPVNIAPVGVQVLKLQAEGYSKPQIAEKLGMKLETVRYHSKAVYRKLGASGKIDAVQIAKSIGII